MVREEIRMKKIKATAWDLVERMKVLLKGDRVKLDGEHEAETKWIQGEMLEPDYSWDPLHPGEEEIRGWQMCFVGGLAAAEHLLLTPGTQRGDLTNIHSGALQTKQGKDALRACAEIIQEQFPERAVDRELTDLKQAQSVVIDFNDDDRTTLEDVYTVLEKAAVVLAEKGK